MGADYKLTQEDIDAICSPEDRRAIEALGEIYGETVEEVLNRLHALIARIGILSGVAPEQFAAGVKFHWDSCAEAIERGAPARQERGE